VVEQVGSCGDGIAEHVDSLLPTGGVADELERGLRGAAQTDCAGGAGGVIDAPQSGLAAVGEDRGGEHVGEVVGGGDGELKRSLTQQGRRSAGSGEVGDHLADARVVSGPSFQSLPPGSSVVTGLVEKVAAS
jgi:hypothetical protein